MKDSRQLTPAEFQIMEILWESSRSLPVSAVHEEISKAKSTAYTTVMTLLDKMARKGSIGRRRKGKAYFYRPQVSRLQVLDFLVKDFADIYLNGEPAEFAALLTERFQSNHPQRAPLPAEDLDVTLL